MFILLNGAFGIGKTTTARAIVAAAADAAIYDPEPLGIALQRLSAVRPRGRVDDFQDLASWRRLIAWRARARHRRGGALIIPMAFANLAYLDGLAIALERSAPVHRLCLTAPVEVVHARLRQRARREETAVDGWAVDRAETCCRAHRSAAFGRPIDATRSTAAIVDKVFALGLLDRR